MFNYATTNAARALDHPGIGRIAPGMKADLAVFNLMSPAMTPRVSALSNLLHYGHPGLVTDTMVDGRFLMRNARLTTMDETEVLTQGQQATESLWRKFAAEDRGVPLPATDPA